MNNATVSLKHAQESSMSKIQQLTAEKEHLLNEFKSLSFTYQSDFDKVTSEKNELIRQNQGLCCLECLLNNILHSFTSRDCKTD